MKLLTAHRGRLLKWIQQYHICLHCTTCSAWSHTCDRTVDWWMASSFKFDELCVECVYLLQLQSIGKSRVFFNSVQPFFFQSGKLPNPSHKYCEKNIHLCIQVSFFFFNFIDSVLKKKAETFAFPWKRKIMCENFFRRKFEAKFRI